MNKTRTFLAATLLLFPLAGTPLYAASPELSNVESATEVVKGFSELPLKCIPATLMHDAKGVAVFQHLVKAGFLFDRRFGCGVVMVRQPSGAWSDPVFVTLDGGGFGLEAGIQATDLVLVFKTKSSVDRILKGKLTLGGDVAVAVGPLGRDAEMATNKGPLTEIYSYSRSRGLFVGVSLEGVRLQVDGYANETFYNLPGCRPEDVLNHRGPALPAVEALKAQLNAMSTPLVGPPPPVGPPPVIVTPR